MKELIQQDVPPFGENPWRAKFVKYFIGNKSDLINVNGFRKRLKIPAEEKFEVGVAKAIYKRKIELGIIERDMEEVSFAHALFVTKRMQSNIPKQSDTLETYLLRIPTDEAVAFVKILVEKERAFNKQTLMEAK